MNRVVLVNKNNRPLGVMEKLNAHKKGVLHRGFSVFVLNKNKELLIQKRNFNKYHSGGLWSNTVCSHPAPGERYFTAVHRRLKEEMGFDCKLKKIGQFIYYKTFDNGLTENELDRVYVGKYDGKIIPNQEEIADYRWIGISELKKSIASNPEKYTYWFKEIILTGMLGDFS